MPLATGILPEAILHTSGSAVLAAFVAINTVMYCALALAKTLPKIYPTDWLPRRGRRAEPRSIHPHAPSEGVPTIVDRRDQTA